MQITPPGESPFLSARQIQALLGISRSTFYRMLSEGKLPQATIQPMSGIKRWHVVAINEAIKAWATDAGALDEKE